MVAGANLALRFLLELAGIVALGYWGFSASSGTTPRVVLGVGAPLLLIAVWAVVVAPGASNPLPQLARMGLGTVLLELAAGALFVAGHTSLAVAFGVVVLLNAALMVALGQ